MFFEVPFLFIVAWIEKTNLSSTQFIPLYNYFSLLIVFLVLGEIPKSIGQWWAHSHCPEQVIIDIISISFILIFPESKIDFISFFQQHIPFLCYVFHLFNMFFFVNFNAYYKPGRLPRLTTRILQFIRQTRSLLSFSLYFIISCFQAIFSSKGYGRFIDICKFTKSISNSSLLSIIFLLL